MSSVPPSPLSPSRSSEYDSSDEIPRILSPTQCSESDSHQEYSKISGCRFCDSPTDTNIRSSDGRVFGAHFSHLKQFTGGLVPLCDSPLRETGEYCQVPFDSEVVRLILAVLHPKRPPPDVHHLGFDVVKRFAEAVETYEVFPAMAFCRFYMSMQAETHPIDVFTYALKHDHRRLASRFLDRNETASMPPEDMRLALSDRHDLFGVLMLYQYNLISEARDIFVLSHVSHPTSGKKCTLWDHFYSLVLKEHFGKEFSLAGFDDTLTRLIHLVEECRFCVSGVKQWREAAVRKVEGRKGFWELLDELNGKETEIKAENDESEMF
ncbi:hypothetical protein PM082_016426 [Marasmius tenuissimus]|nr:hypothetical protein PM082_016426 [Marasmius tenuissimus]